LRPVVAFPAVQAVDAGPGVEGVVALPTDGVVVAGPESTPSLPSPALTRSLPCRWRSRRCREPPATVSLSSPELRCRYLRGVDVVEAGVADDVVLTALAVKPVVAVVAVEEIVAGAAEERVVAAETKKRSSSSSPTRWSLPLVPVNVAMIDPPKAGSGLRWGSRFGAQSRDLSQSADCEGAGLRAWCGSGSTQPSSRRNPAG
jgi:hypothetical protein